jgi:hypothetical protein
MRLIGFVVFILLMLSIAIEIQTQDRNRQLDRIEETTARNEKAAREATRAANKASADLAEAIEASRQGSGGAARAVQVIFEIEQILCEVFPQVRICEEGG